MAKCTVQMPEDFLMKVSKLVDRTDDILPKVLEAGADVVDQKVRKNLSAAIGKGKSKRSTGQLLTSLGTSKPLQDRDGNLNVKIGFAEGRTDGENNAKLASILEYGKHGQAPRPFLKPAKSQSKNACIQAMIDKLESEVGKI